MPSKTADRPLLWREELFARSSATKLYDLCAGIGRLSAGEFARWVRRELPYVDDLRPIEAGSHAHCRAALRSPHAVPLGDRYALMSVLLPKGQSLRIHRRDRWHLIAFDDDLPIPMLFDRRNDRAALMSMTPSEVITQKVGLDRAKGRVLVAGLGMGWLASRVHRKGSVTQVIVVEQDPDIDRYFRPKLNFAPDKSFHVEVADFWEFAESQDLSAYDSILVDTFAGYGEAGRHGKFKALQRRLGKSKVWGWGDFQFP